MVVLISGNGSNLQAIIDQCQNERAKIVAVISDVPDVYGLTRAKQANIANHCLPAQLNETRTDYDKRLAQILTRYAADIIILAGFMRIIGQALTSKYAGKILNIHPALLPKYPGLNTHNRAIAAGDKFHGASVHFVTPILDSGPIIIQAKVPILDNDSGDALAKRVQQQEHIIYPMAVNWLTEQRLTIDNNQVFLDQQSLGLQGYQLN